MIPRRLQQLFAPTPTTPQPPPSFSMPDGVRAYAVGDIHGRLGLLQKMLAAINADAAQNPAATTVEIFLGDYIDRGMQSREVIDLLIAPPANGHTRICLMGNHEEALLNFLRDPTSLRGWANFGGYATLASYGIAIPTAMTPEALRTVRDDFQKKLPAAHETFLRQSKLSHTLGDYLFVHAGILPGVALEAQKPEHLLWIRQPFLNHSDYFPHYIVHGHSPVSTPEIHDNRANIDISDAQKPGLACLVIEGSTRRIIHVE